ncbi:hypothetical protein imdm_235 [gamma proteobacterium IMCC2047]|nr:hypothetical protein imdm_235 [gamma proteobacterium IMCC2047]
MVMPSKKIPDRYLRIAEVASLSGISASTLRFWEQHKLIKPDYTDTGQRLYTQNHLEQIRDIQRLRTVQGLSLAAIPSLQGRSTAEINTESNHSHQSSWSKPNLGIGPQLRALRNKKNLSLRDVASKTGLAASLISTLERTSTGASAASIHKLAAFYDTSVTELSKAQASSAPRQESGVVRADEARVVAMFGPDIRIEQRAPNDAAMDCQKWTLQPGTSSEEAYSHEGEEFIYVLRGLLEVVLDGCERQLLYPGDNIYFDSNRPHSWHNPGEEETLLIWVNTPPSF